MSDTQAKIQQLVSENDVVLFMKGTPQMPQCGFSATAVDVLSELGLEPVGVNVLADPAIRQGIKEFSQWPTIPQLYIKGEFVGGSDIIKQMAASGELHQMAGVPFEPPKAPAITITDAMKGAFESAGASAGEMLRLVVAPGFRYQLGIDRQQPNDFVVESNGVSLLVDKASAKKADGITLDFEEGEGGGVLIDNPNEPPRVRPMDVRLLKRMLDSGRSLTLVDVRTDQERATALISEDSVQLTQAKMVELEQLPKDTLLVFHCHHGGRSQQAAQHFVSAGFTKVYNVEGGIDAWSMFVDSSVPRY